MRVLNKSTGIVEFSGRPEDFIGIELLDTVLDEDGNSSRRNDDYEITHSSEDRKLLIQGEVSRRYGVNGNPVSAALSIIGKVGDATSLNIDAMVHDIIAISETASTAYSQSRIRLFEEIHGEGSWALAVEFANQWHAGRKDKTIAMPFDAKGIAEVVTESADLGGFVKAVIADANEQQSAG